MPVFREAVDRLSDLLRGDGKVTHCTPIDARKAIYLSLMLQRIAPPSHHPAGFAEGGWPMLDWGRQTARSRGCDATHRASNSDTHLTHGCMPVFRRFSRLRGECAAQSRFQHGAIRGFFGSAARTPGEAAR